MDTPQFSERSTRRFFSSADRRRVTVDHLPVASFGFLPLGFRPLTAPLPTLNHGLTLLDGVVPSAFYNVHDGRIPTAVARSSTNVLTLKQGTVKPRTGGTLLEPAYGYAVHDQNLARSSTTVYRLGYLLALPRPEPERVREVFFSPGLFIFLKLCCRVTKSFSAYYHLWPYPITPTACG